MSTPPLAALLTGYRNTALQTMGLLNGWFKQGVPKAEMVQRLARECARASHVTKMLGEMDPAARRALACLQTFDGQIDRDSLFAALEEDGIATTPRRKQRAGYYRDDDLEVGQPRGTSQAAQDVVARLEARGLVLGLTPEGVYAPMLDFGMALEFAIPAEVRPHLPSRPVEARPTPPPAFAREVPGNAATVSRDLFLLWSYIHRHEPQPLQSGLLAKRDLKALSTQLGTPFAVDKIKGEDELPELHFQRQLLQASELVTTRSGGLQGDPRQARRHWRAPLADRAAAWLAAWYGMTGWNELARLPAAGWRGYRHERESAPAALLKARRVIAEHIGRAGAAAEWTGVASLARAMQRTARDFLVPPPQEKARRDQGYYYGRSASHRYVQWKNAHGWQFDNVFSERDGWERVEAVIIGMSVVALHRLGLLDVGLADDGSVAAFRLNAMGRHVLLGEPAPPAPDVAGARVVLQPNFHIVVMGPVPEATVLEIEGFADRETTDRALTFKLSRDSLYRAQAAGTGASVVLAQIEALTGAPVPQNIVRSLEEWQNLHERIVIHRGITLVQAADPRLLAELREAGGTTLTPLTPVLARSAKRARVLDLVEKQGQVPTTQHDRSAAGSVMLDDDGHISMRQKVPDVFVLGRLQRLADWNADAARWTLTRAAVQRARQSLGLDGPAQVKAWSALIAGDAPEWLDRRIKAWSAHYAPARLHRTWMLELPDEDAFKDIQSHPELARRLKRFQSKGPLLAVGEADVDDMRALLAEFGIEIK